MSVSKGGGGKGGSDAKLTASKGLDYDAIAAKLKEHAQGEHIDELTERLSGTFINYKKSIGNKRKLDFDQAEALGHQLYDALSDYIVSEHYKAKPEDAKVLKGLKGKHGNKLLDDLVSNAFKINRTQLIHSLKEHSESGKNFSSNYIQELMKRSLNEYHGHVQSHILGEITEDHVGDLKKQIEMYISKGNLDKKEYNSVRKSNDINRVLPAFVQLASTHYQPEEKKPEMKKAA